MYKLTGDKFNIAGRGEVYTALLTVSLKRDELRQFVGTKLVLPDGEEREIIGVESFCVDDQYVGRPIGFLVKRVL